MKKIILVDDDELVQMTWKLLASKSDVELIVYSSPTEFFNQENLPDKITPIYTDHCFSNDGLNGVQFAQKLREMGHISLHLVTGHDPYEFKDLDLFESVGAKEPPFL
jgi:FixJ family two-component response regulator